MNRRSRWTISQRKQAIKETRDNLEYRHEKVAWFTVKYNDKLQETEVIHSERLLDLAETDPSIFASATKQFKQLSLRGSEPPQYLQDWHKKVSSDEFERPLAPVGPPKKDVDYILIRMAIDDLVEIGFTATRNNELSSNSERDSACDIVAAAFRSAKHIRGPKSFRRIKEIYKQNPAKWKAQSKNN